MMEKYGVENATQMYKVIKKKADKSEEVLGEDLPLGEAVKLREQYGADVIIKPE